MRVFFILQYITYFILHAYFYIHMKPIINTFRYSFILTQEIRQTFNEDKIHEKKTRQWVVKQQRKGEIEREREWERSVEEVSSWNSSRHISSGWLQRGEYAKIESIIFLNGRCQMVTLGWSAVQDHRFPSAICDVWKIQPKCAHKLEIRSTFSYRRQAR